MAGMMAAGHPDCRYVATVDMSYPVYSMNAVRKAFEIELGGQAFYHRAVASASDPAVAVCDRSSVTCS